MTLSCLLRSLTPPAKTCIHNESHYNDILKDSLTREALLPEDLNPETQAESSPEINPALITESESEPKTESTPEAIPESKPVDKAVNLSEVPSIMKSTAEYLLFKTGRASLTESELSSLRTLSATHYPSRVQKEIDRACERFKRKGHDLQNLSFNYIAGALKNQKSRKMTVKPQAIKHDSSAKLTQAEIDQSQGSFSSQVLASLTASLGEEF